MQKKSLSGVNKLISLLFCDPSQKIYEIDAVLDGHRFSTFSNSVHLPENSSDIHISVVSEILIRNYLMQLRSSFDCDSFYPFERFVDSFKNLKASKDEKKDENKD